jgi:hypothetical protein
MTAHKNTAALRVVLLGDHETIDHLDNLTDLAAAHGATVTNVFSFEPGAAGSHPDLTEVEALVAALGCAIATGTYLWVPHPMPDLVREQHFRRISLVLQRHGLNLVFGSHLATCPTEGGMTEADFALRVEVHAVDALDRAALAAAGAKLLVREIETALKTASERPLAHPQVRGGRRLPFDLPSRVGHASDDPVSPEYAAPQRLLSPNAPWNLRRIGLKQFAQWLVGACELTQSAVADCLNAAGHRTPQGRLWRQPSVSALIHGRYDGSCD